MQQRGGDVAENSTATVIDFVSMLFAYALGVQHAGFLVGSVYAAFDAWIVIWQRRRIAALTLKLVNTVAALIQTVTRPSVVRYLVILPALSLVGYGIGILGTGDLIIIDGRQTAVGTFYGLLSILVGLLVFAAAVFFIRTAVRRCK